jgi:hypothetical protein
MRAILLVCLLAVLSSCTTLPTADRRKALFTGRIISVQHVDFVPDGVFELPLWRAEIEITSKRPDVCPERLTTYYIQNGPIAYMGADGKVRPRGAFVTCASWPDIRTNRVQRLECVRKDVGNKHDVWYIRWAR